MSNVTPMMQQYLKIKSEYQDCLLFFRLGDFYEMFYEDAKEASRVLEITLTKEMPKENPIPMCEYHTIRQTVISIRLLIMAIKWQFVSKWKTLSKQRVWLDAKW